ncbi:putative membrane protein [Dehalogenimonas formicexedens]|uniref:Putative membrane protein n=1 Tax=Dehalogenimonas formicexedens TaxID=1839801 RepID=A0A1P8F8I3_9CHLR|nr:DUF502 domain-containing protein [Dehalogenimonas formicexedens]APV44712.1 putative membrane protein [Dehalogenimonas formicexedens]
MAETKRHRLTATLRKDFVAGLLFLVPFLAAIVILLWVFNTIDGFLQPVIRLIFGHEIVGLGVVSTIVLIFVTGLVLQNYLGRFVLRNIDKALEHVPIFSQIYTGAKQVMTSIGGAKNAAFKEAVLVDFPQKGVKSLAFITNELEDNDGQKIYVVYVPGSPNPTSGFLQLLRENQIVRPELAVDCAMRMIVSCGMVTPDKCNTFGLNDGYRAIVTSPEPLGGDSIPPGAVPIKLSEVETLKVSSCKLEEQEKLKHG